MHGVPVADPFRHLEEDSETTKAFVAAQQGVFAAYAGASEFSGLRGKLRVAMEDCYNFPRVGAPSVRGGCAFFFKNTGLQNQDVLFKAALPARGAQPRALEDLAEPVPLLDLNAEFPAGTTSINTYSFSEDGSLMAYALAHGGSDWVTIKVRDVATGADLPHDVIPWVKFSGISWLKDGSGFFYSRYPSPPDVVVAAGGDAGAGAKSAGTETAANVCAFVMFHALGTPPAADLLVYASPEQPQWRSGAHVSDCGRFIFLSTSKSTDPVNRFYVARVATFKAWAAGRAPFAPAPAELPPPQAAGGYLPFRRVVDNFDAQYDVVAAVGRRLYLQTNLKAPRGRLLALELPPEDAAAWEDAAPVFPAGAPPPGGIDAPAASTPEAALLEVLPEHATEVLDWAAHVAGDKLVTCVMKDVVNALRVYTLPGAGAAPGAPLPPPAELALPGPGTVASFSGRPELPRVYFKFVSFTTPGTTLTADLSGAAGGGGGGGALPSSKYWAAELPGFDPEQFVVKQEFVEASDGAKIPVFLVHKKGLALPAPTLLYAYGGFNISMQPSFSSIRLPWLSKLNGVYALACIRGGGEYGEVAWHQAGARLNKRVSFNDFAAVARALAAKGVTEPSRLAIMGGSNGGLLTLASSLRTPELFAAAVSQVPVADFLRFGLHTIGHAWRGEYGFVEDREDFFNMLCLSPCALLRGHARVPRLFLTRTHTHAPPLPPPPQTTRRSPRALRRPSSPSPQSFAARRTTMTAWCRCTRSR
jgi:prolyl oligopeptidase